MRWLHRCLLATAVCTLSGSARAEGAQPSAGEEFQRGLSLAQSGDLDAAVRAFQSAYQMRPHYAVLYNLGQAYVRLGKPVEAVNALEQFLRDGGERIDPARRREVEGVLNRERERIGRVEISVTPEGAEVFIDDQRVDPASVVARPLAVGRHVIAARKSGHASRVEYVEIRANDTVRLSLDLETTEPVLGQLSIACELPAVEVSVDGLSHGRTPFEAPLLVPVGTRTVRFARFGYRTIETSLDVGEKPARLGCRLAVDLSGVRPGRLKVSPSERFSRVSVDGRAFDDAPLPPGMHAVRVERSGYRPWTRNVVVEPGGVHTMAAILEPTPEYVAELEEKARSQRHVAIGVGATGVVLVGTSIALFVWNGERYDDWQADEGGSNRSSRATSIQRVDDLAVGTAVLGGAALVTAGVLWLTSGSPPRPANARSGARK
jgi:hypothetical protein